MATVRDTINEISDRFGDLEVQYRKVGDLKPYPRNARTHSKKQIRQIVESIKQFGWTLPILVDEDGMILAGHGRIEAARLLGLVVVPVIQIEHLTEAQKRAYILADNKLAENAGWDPKILAIELQTLIELDTEFDITITGFETGEIDFAIQSINEDEDNEADHVPDLDGTTPVVTKPGDLWQLGDHRLLCADATDPASFDQLMGDEKAEMIAIDPPYNVSVKNISGRGRIQHDDFVMASGEMSATQYIEFLQTSLSNLAQYSADGSIHFICMDWRHMGELLAAGNAIYSELKNLCVWVKSNAGMGTLYRSRHELIFVFKNGAGEHINNVELGRFGRNRSNVWEYAGANSFHDGRQEELAMHPTVKPVSMIADAILDCSHRGGIILDSFAGSGTTIIAAEKTGRRAYALELDPKYVDCAIRRFEAYTDKAAIHEESGKSFTEMTERRAPTMRNQKEEQKDESINVRGTHVR